MLGCWAVVALCLALCGCYVRGNEADSLRSALEAISRRQRDLPDVAGPVYYLETPTGRYRPTSEEIAVLVPRRPFEGDGQPEDIGYGYQKSVAPKTAGVFEPVPLPSSVLGSGDTYDGHSRKALEKLILEYLEDNMDNSYDNSEDDKFKYADAKRSIFREREDSHLPEALQRLYLGESSHGYDDNDQTSASSFRERFKGRDNKNALRGAVLVRNFGGLDRDTERRPHDDADDSDEYMNVLNTVWEKYKDSNSDNIDPEDISETDVEDLLDMINRKEDKKRQYGNSYAAGYDFFNSPLGWSKRSRQRLDDSHKQGSDNFVHALKFIPGNRETLEAIRVEEEPDDDGDDDVTTLLMDQKANPYRNEKPAHRKRLWRDGSFDERYPYTAVVKRYPITKRSYTSPAVMYHKPSNIVQRKKKNAGSTNANINSEGSTDPKVAEELNNIFSPKDKRQSTNSSSSLEETSTSADKVHTTTKNQTSPDSNKTVRTNNKTIEVADKGRDHMHVHSKRSGQKEESTSSMLYKPLEISKKSVNWSEYFGIDRRRKKSLSNNGINDEWLLNQYMKAYNLADTAVKDDDDRYNEVESRFDMPKQKASDDIDAKLRAMEDLIVDQALKYTGAHEGITNSKEVQEVKDKVISQLAAAYSLEKMRRALSEFKSSIAAQKPTSPEHTTTSPTEVGNEHKDKRIAVKKEKAELPADGKLEKKDNDLKNDINVNGVADPRLSQTDSRFRWQTKLPYGQDEWSQECPVLNEVTQRCREIAVMAGDMNEAFLPICNIHQICYLCGSKLDVSPSGCDVTFLTEANSLCHDNASCRYTARRTVAAMHSVKADPSSTGCDWQNQPCLAHFLAMAAR